MSRRPGKEVAAQAAGGQRFSGEKASYFRSGAGKSMDIMRSTMNSMESSGPRHVRSRGISASARRERVHYSEDDEDDDGDEEEEEEDADEDVDDQSGPYDDYGPFSQRLDDVYETRRVDVRKGRDGRFVSRSGTSSASTVSAVSRKRSRAVNDSWVVRGEVAGGPIDGSVIPSFLGHIATRIWEDQERALDSAGTAFTRSVGDSTAENIGVIAAPEVSVVQLTPDHLFFVIASDGVFEFLPSQAVVDLVSSNQDPRDACSEIVGESYKLWLTHESRTDDITIIIVHIKGLSNSNAGLTGQVSKGDAKPPSARMKNAASDLSDTTRSDLNPSERNSPSDQQPCRPIISVDQSAVTLSPSYSQPA